MEKNKLNQTGQIAVVLLLTLLITLSIGLIVSQRSITDVSTSTQSEQSSRAFSAAEAGIEKSLLSTGASLVTGNITEAELGNNAKADFKSTELLPNKLGQALEYPPIGKEIIAQFWLANKDTLVPIYKNGKFELFFGDINKSQTDPPGLAVYVYTRNPSTGAVSVIKKYYDPLVARNGSTRLFIDPTDALGLSCAASVSTPKLAVTSNSSSSPFYCQATVDMSSCSNVSTCTPVLIRARILYSNLTHPVALAPNTSAGGLTTINYIPRQATLHSATGKSGQSVKRLQTFTERKVVPYFFDYAIFSVSDITKK